MYQITRYPVSCSRERKYYCFDYTAITLWNRAGGRNALKFCGAQQSLCRQYFVRKRRLVQDDPEQSKRKLESHHSARRYCETFLRRSRPCAVDVKAYATRALTGTRQNDKESLRAATVINRQSQRSTLWLYRWLKRRVTHLPQGKRP